MTVIIASTSKTSKTNLKIQFQSAELYCAAHLHPTSDLKSKILVTSMYGICYLNYNNDFSFVLDTLLSHSLRNGFLHSNEEKYPSNFPSPMPNLKEAMCSMPKSDNCSIPPGRVL